MGPLYCPPLTPKGRRYNLHYRPLLSPQKKMTWLETVLSFLLLIASCPTLLLVRASRFCFVQSLSPVQLFAIPWTAACQASLSCTIFWSLLKLMSLESVMPSNHLVLCHPFSSCLQSFPASWSFLVSQLFTSGGQSVGTLALASVFPMNIQR